MAGHMLNSLNNPHTQLRDRLGEVQAWLGEKARPSSSWGGERIMTSAPKTTMRRSATTKETIMCRPITCEVCGKTTWKGCGKHIDSVKEQVPPDQWCDKNHTDEEYALAEKKSSFFGSFCS